MAAPETRLAEKQRASEILKGFLSVGAYWGSKDWADAQTKYLVHLLSDNSTWNLSHNWYFKRLIASIIISRLREAGFEWHVSVVSGHFHRWLARKSWEAPK